MPSIATCRQVGRQIGDKWGTLKVLFPDSLAGFTENDRCLLPSESRRRLRVFIPVAMDYRKAVLLLSNSSLVAAIDSGETED